MVKDEVDQGDGLTSNKTPTGFLTFTQKDSSSNFIFLFFIYILNLGMDGNSHEDQTLVVLSSTCTASLLLLAGHFIRTKVWFLRAL